MSEGDIPHQRDHSLAYQRWQARRFIENSRLINPLNQGINWWMNHCEEVVEAMNTIDKIEFYLGNIEKIGSLKNRQWVS
jgi:hypothetical protein